jgi:hypothetical protein
LAGLSLSYAGAPLKPEKGGEDAYGIVQGRQVLEIKPIPFEMSAKTKESFGNTHFNKRGRGGIFIVRGCRSRHEN